MIATEVVLIIIGIFCICVSFFVAGKRNAESANPDDVMQTTSDIWTEKDEEMIKERVTEILEENQIELVESTEDQLNRICNEKIMAVDEFSKQLLEKIEQNHQEVVFMYNMLNEKQKEVKEAVVMPVKKVEKPVVATTTPTVPVQPEKKAEPKKAVPKKEIPKKTAPVKTKSVSNVNAKIQQMYKEGKSVLEISKALNIGQGEVKLVIALYGGKGR